MHPVHQLAAAETALIANLRAATDRIDAVGTAELDAAVLALRSAAFSARDRLAGASALVRDFAADLLAELGAFAWEIEPFVESIPLPAPEPTPVAEAPAEVPTPAAWEDGSDFAGHVPANRVGSVAFAPQTLPFAGAAPGTNGKAHRRKKR